MTISNIYSQSQHIQGDAKVLISRGNINNQYMELCLYAYSSKWDKVNANVLYKRKHEDIWQNDTKIISAPVDLIDNNKLYGLKTSAYGFENKILWDYKKNHISKGENIDIKINILPSIRQFSLSKKVSISTNLYGINSVDLINVSNDKLYLGINNSNQYIMGDINNVYVVENGDIIYQKSGFLKPSYAIQIENGNYLICDTTGNGKIIELDFNLENVLKEHFIGNPKFIDYSESRGVILVTVQNPDRIVELTWNNLNHGVTLWQINSGLNEPTSATYSRGIQGNIVISDCGNHRVIVYNVNAQEYTSIDNAFFNEEISPEESIKITYPFRSYQLQNGKILIVERKGNELDWDDSMPGIGDAIIEINFVVS